MEHAPLPPSFPIRHIPFSLLFPPAKYLRRPRSLPFPYAPAPPSLPQPCPSRQHARSNRDHLAGGRGDRRVWGGGVTYSRRRDTLACPVRAGDGTGGSGGTPGPEGVRPHRSRARRRITGGTYGAPCGAHSRPPCRPPPPPVSASSSTCLPPSMFAPIHSPHPLLPHPLLPHPLLPHPST